MASLIPEMGNIRIDPSGAMQNYMNASRALGSAIQQPLDTINALQERNERDKRLALQDARQAALDAQNKQLFDLKMAEVDRALEKEQALENLNKGLFSLPTTKTGPDVLIKGTPQSAVDAATQRLVDQKLESAGNVYAEEFARLTTPASKLPAKPVPSDYKTVSNYEKRIAKNPGSSAVIEQYYDTETGDKLMFNPKGIPGKLLYGDKYYDKSVLQPKQIPAMSIEEAHKLALAKAGLSDNMKATDVLTKQEMASLPKATADRIEKGETVSLNDAQMLEAQKNYIRGQVSAGNIPANIGVARLQELEKAAKKDDVSAATQLSMLRLQRDLKKDELSLQKEAQKLAEEAREKVNKLNKERLESKDTLNTLNSIFERFGSPDIIGTGDETKIERDVLDLKNKYKLTDNQMSNLLRQVQNKYPATFGVNEDAIVKGLEELLMKK